MQRIVVQLIRIPGVAKSFGKYPQSGQVVSSNSIYTARMLATGSRYPKLSTFLIQSLFLSWLLLTCSALTARAQQAEESSAASTPHPSASPSAARAGGICAPCVRANMNFLASDALQGRGSSTRDEWIAASYIASQLEQYGIEPAGDDGTYLQRATLVRRKVISPPKVIFKSAGKQPRTVVWVHGKQILAAYLGAVAFSGPLQKLDLTRSQRPKIKAGAVLLLSGPEDEVRDAAYEFAGSGASAVLVPESARLRSHWKERGSKLPEEPTHVEGVDDSTMMPKYPVIAIKDEYRPVLERVPEGTRVSMKTATEPAKKTFTWNVIGRIRGSDPEQQQATILLTAHLDHLGIGAPVGGDEIYNGADDDASGTVAVLEFARMLASHPKLRRTVTFALFGSEELGGLGSSYFREHPPVPLKDIAAYLEFEMIGRPDSAVPKGTLWLTGWERSNLGPALAEHGASLVADPHADQDFFRRSDNYVFAKAGVVAQTVSSYGLHKDYHRPSDDIAHIDFQHMDEGIESLFEPVLWLVNSDFVPHWNPGKQP